MKIKNSITNIFNVLAIWIFFSLFPFNHALAFQFNYQLLEAFPGFYAENATPDFPSLVLSIYKFGIWTVGIAGLFMIVIGGIMYMTSAGNTSTAGTAKGIITDALIGIITALAAYLVLYVINPDFVKLDLSLKPVEVSETTGSGDSTAGSSTGNTSPTGTCDGTSIGCCKPGVSCVACKNCGSFSNSYSNLCYKGAAGFKGCKLNSTLASKLQNANLAGNNAEVSEAWPPTMSHKSLCHQDGTCADVRCKNGCANASVASVKKIYDGIKAAGLNPVFETYSGNCGKYEAAGIYCKPYPTMTSPSFHVNM